MLDQYTEPACTHGKTAKATCGNCGNSWCDDCDPTPSALCHWCNGRGYSTAPIGRVKALRVELWDTEPATRTQKHTGE
jgi:hypothetical protein